jgi:methionyl-tRNA formyltransferase
MIRVLTKERHVQKIREFLDEHNLENEIFTLKDEIPDTEFDLGICYIWTRKITEPLLSKPNKGWINFHPAPLPKYPGWKYVDEAIKNKETSWGVTVHYMDEEYDHGPIIKMLPIDLHEPPIIFHELASVSYHFLFSLFKEIVADVYNGKYESSRV